MEWLTAITSLIGQMIWPATLITFFVMFRREIRQRLTDVTEVKYPGGSITMREVERLEARVVEVAQADNRGAGATRAPSSLPAPHSDSRLAVAQLRLETERELFLLARHALHSGEAAAGWTAERYLDELEADQRLDDSLVAGLREFVALANRIVHDPDVEEGVVERASAVGAALIAALRHKRLVSEALSDFERHGLWHMHRDEEGEARKYYFWSAVAASLPLFDYDYDVYREAGDRYNVEHPKRLGQGRDRSLYVLSLEEFIQVLEFRERELVRLIEAWTSQGWDGQKGTVEWHWPTEWGHIPWSGPVLHERAHKWGAEEDLQRTRAAITYYRQRLRAARRDLVVTQG